MSEMKKYMSVVRLGHATTVGVLKANDNIVIQEKIDGANASFKLEDGKVVAFSRNNQLSEHNTLHGFYQFAQTINPELLAENIIYFGEWTCPHKIDYGKNTHKFYLFDTYDLFSNSYLHFYFTRAEAVRLKLNLVPIFYEGEYKSFEHLQQFIGKTQVGLKDGEGIVVKNIYYTDPYGRQLFVKLVSDAFAEIKKQKKPKDPNSSSPAQEAVKSVVVKARVEKMLYKLIDEGILHKDYGIEDMGIILKNMYERIYEDVVKEEYDIIKNFEERDVRKVVGKILPIVVKNIILENRKQQCFSRTNEENIQLLNSDDLYPDYYFPSSDTQEEKVKQTCFYCDVLKQKNGIYCTSSCQ